MRIPDLVMAELQKQPQFTLREWSIYVWAMYLQPRSVRDLAVNPGLVMALCGRRVQTAGRGGMDDDAIDSRWDPPDSAHPTALSVGSGKAA